VQSDDPVGTYPAQVSSHQDPGRDLGVWQWDAQFVEKPFNVPFQFFDPVTQDL
jgi:hypothetical protein